MNEKPNYYAVIPANVRYDEDLKANAKLLYGEITALTYKTGICYASNNYFARLYQVDASSVSKWIKNLQDKNYIEVEYIKENNQIIRRDIKIVGIDKNQYVLTKDQEGYCKKVKENNTSINNISINIKEKINKREKFKKPTIEEVKNYIQEKSLNVIAEAFIDYYDSNGWKVGKNQMKDWKATIRGWARREVKNSYQRTEKEPEWYGKQISEVQATEEEMQELEKRIKSL